MNYDRQFRKDLSRANKFMAAGWKMLRFDEEFFVFYFKSYCYDEYRKFVQQRWDQRKHERLVRKLAEVTEGCGVETKRRM